MNLEVSREVFKQRVCEKHNFAIIDLESSNTFESAEALNFSANFASDVGQKWSDKNQNILVFTLSDDSTKAQDAANALTEAGYNYVYFYKGNKTTDSILDKGIN